MRSADRSDTWVVPGTGHLLAMQHVPAEYVDRIYRFLVSCRIHLKAEDVGQIG